MQQVCLLFAGRRGLDEYQTRQSVLRIPEVSRKLKAVQEIVDQKALGQGPVDLLAHTLSSDDDFCSQPKLRSLVAATVQLGLFERYMKFHHRPQFLVGPMNGASALQVASQQCTLEEFVEKSELLKPSSNVGGNLTELSGVSLEEYGVFSWNKESNSYEIVESRSRDAGKIVEGLSLENLIQQCVHIGPCHDFRLREFERNEIHQISSLSSIEMDPILNSFWKSA